jgi:hypothetical protein
MRALLSSALFYLAYVVGFAAAIGWGYFIWDLDFGTSVRGRGLWWMTFSVGSVIAFLVGLFVMVALHSHYFPDEDQLDDGL